MSFYHTIEGQLQNNNTNTNRRLKVSIQFISSIIIKNSRVYILGGHNVSGIGFNVTLVDTALDENVACESPTGSPRIADDPIVDSVESAPSDQDDCVIH